MEPITVDDLARLAEFAVEQHEWLYRRRPEWRGRLICVALCQGAGLHFVDLAHGKRPPNGVKDFDVYSFFSQPPGVPFTYYRQPQHRDFGPSKFGRWPDEPVKFRHYRGRRVDLMMRGLECDLHVDPVVALRDYLTRRKSDTARHLAAKGVVLISPTRRRSEIAWQP